MNTYSDQMINGQVCTWLQYYGWCPTKKGSEVKAGDVLVYNFGKVYRVIAKVKETGAFCFLTVQNMEGGENYEVRISKNKNQAVR